jgi:hypothetical protein
MDGSSSSRTSRTDKSLPELFRLLVAAAIDEDGVYPHQAVVRYADGRTECLALGLSGEMVCHFVVGKAYHADVTEVIYGVGRFARTGQGTRFADVVAGAYFQRELGWRPLVIEYQHAPRIIRPIDWANRHWVDLVRRELALLGIHDVVGLAA